MQSEQKSKSINYHIYKYGKINFESPLVLSTELCNAENGKSITENLAAKNKRKTRKPFFSQIFASILKMKSKGANLFNFQHERMKPADNTLDTNISRNETDNFEEITKLITLVNIDTQSSSQVQTRDSSELCSVLTPQTPQSYESADYFMCNPKRKNFVRTVVYSLASTRRKFRTTQQKQSRYVESLVIMRSPASFSNSTLDNSVNSVKKLPLDLTGSSYYLSQPRRMCGPGEVLLRYDIT